MKAKMLAASLALAAFDIGAADQATALATGNGQPAQARAAKMQASVPEVGAGEALNAMLELASLMGDYNKAVGPLGDHYHPFSLWSKQTGHELDALIEPVKYGKTPAEIVASSKKVQQKILEAIKIAHAIVPIDVDVQSLESHIADTSACLAKRNAALQQADAKIKEAIKVAMGGMPVSVASLKSLVTEANAACP